MSLPPALRAAGSLFMVLGVAAACHHGGPPIRFAPEGTSPDRLRAEFALTPAERESLTPETIKRLTQPQLDQVYDRLSPGPIPDGPFRGDLFFPRGSQAPTEVRDLAPSLPAELSALAATPIERLGRVFWKGKVFFRSEGVVRNRIEDLALLRAIIGDTSSIPRLTFDGDTTWLLFPARLSCGPSRRDPAHHAIVIDYSKGPEIAGYREVPDRLAGADRLDILDEVRIVRPGFYLGRAHFRGVFRLNFTLLKPDAPSAAVDASVSADCSG